MRFFNISGVHRCLVLFGCLLFSSFAAALSSQKDSANNQLFSISSVPALKKNEGYLLINLDVGGVAPSIDLIRLYTSRGERYLLPGEPADTKGTEINIDLKDKEKGLYIMPITAGLYQISRVNAPYFSLPYYQDTDRAREWRISIREGKTNYAGTLLIEKQRSTHYVHVRLFNRIATDHAQIVQQLEQILPQAPLVSGSGVKDEFYQIWSESKE